MDHLEKQEELKKKLEELEDNLVDPAILADAQKLGETNKEFHEIKDVLDKLEKLGETIKTIEENKLIVSSEGEGELATLAGEENVQLEENRDELEKEIDEYFNPKNPLDKKSAIMEIRAGTGGDESALFASDLFRMYSRFAEKNEWKMSVVSQNRIGIGGFKEIIFEVEGKGAYGNLKYESGTHRVQRIPETEKSGRIHTSAVTVAVMPEAEDVDVEVKPEDLRIDTFCASGHGGQSVNTTYSAVRITHIPTNTVVSCQDEKSQVQNKKKAMKVLKSRILAQVEAERHAEMSAERKSQIGSGDRSEKIRTYNYPQDRITAPRINKSWHGMDKILDGDLEEVINELKKVDQ